MHSLFNKIFELGYFPEQWTEGHIIPIFKKGDKKWGFQLSRQHIIKHRW